MSEAGGKPALPEGYVVPEVWNFAPQGGAMGAMNRPDAGPRSDATLPVGEHGYQLYSLGTPNGIKVTALLEELGVEYDAWYVDIMKLEQFSSGFVEVNPNSKIPAMYDYCPDTVSLTAARDKSTTPQDAIRLFESGSILLYLADKHQKFVPSGRRERAECLNWLFWQMGTAPYVGGGFGHFFHYAPVNIEYAIDRFTMEVKRQLDVLDRHLGGKDRDNKERQWMCDGEYSIADIAIAPWIVTLKVHYGNGKAAKFLGLDVGYPHVNRWLDAFVARPAVKRGMKVNSFLAGQAGSDALRERHSKLDFSPEMYEETGASAGPDIMSPKQ